MCGLCVTSQKARMLSYAAFAAMVIWTGSASAEGPAVSAPNGKVIPFAGSVSDDGVGGIAGAFTIPLTYSTGVQFDAAAASVDGDAFGGGAVHVFWRDPDVALIGGFASYAYLDALGGQEVSRIGAEMELYQGNLTLDARVGYRFGDLEEDPFGSAELRYYLTDDFVVSGGYEYDHESKGLASLEYQVMSGAEYGASIFVDSRIHSEDSYSVLGGFKVYLASQKSLRDRHRRDDPEVDITDDLDLTLIAAQEEQNRRDSSSTDVQCTVTGLEDRVTDPSDGNCTCPAGSGRAGQQPLLGFRQRAFNCTPQVLLPPPPPPNP